MKKRRSTYSLTKNVLNFNIFMDFIYTHFLNKVAATAWLAWAIKEKHFKIFINFFFPLLVKSSPKDVVVKLAIFFFYSQSLFLTK